MMEAFGAKGFFGEDPKNLKGALAEAMNHRGPALVNIVLSQLSFVWVRPFFLQRWGQLR